MRLKAKGIAKNATFVMVFAFITKILGFIREAVLASFFGATRGTDAYFIATYIPSLMSTFVASALSTATIPVFSEYNDPERKKELDSLYWTLLHLVLFLALVGLIVYVLFLTPIVKSLAPGFSEEGQALTRRLAYIMMPSLIFLCLTEWAKNALHNEKNFIAPAFAGIPFDIVHIIGIALSGVFFGIEGLAWTSVAALMAQFLVHLFGLIQQGMNYRFVLDLHHPGLRKIVSLMAPTFLVILVTQAGGIVEKIIASGLPSGSLSSLNYALRIQGIPQGLFVGALVTVLYPNMADLGASKDLRGFESLFQRGISSILLISMPMALGMVILRQDLVRLFFERGAFTAANTATTSVVVLFLALGLPFAATRDFLNRAFYSLQDTVTPMKISVGLVSLEVFLKFTLSRYLGIAGIAFSSSISYLAGCALSVGLLYNKGYIRTFGFILEATKILLASLGMGAVLLALSRLHQVIMLDQALETALYGIMPSGLASFMGQGITLGIKVIIAGAVFMGISLVFKIRSASYLWEFAKRGLARAFRQLPISKSNGC